MLVRTLSARFTRCLSLSHRHFQNVLLKETPVDEFIPVSTVKRKLLGKELSFIDGYTCLSTECFLCRSKSRLFINKVSGFFICDGCSRSGPWSALELYLNKDKATTIDKDEYVTLGTTKWAKASKRLTRIEDLLDAQKKDILRRLGLPELPVQVLVDLGAHIDLENNDLFLPLVQNVNSTSVVGYKILESDFSEETVPALSAGGLLRKNNGRKEAVLVQSVIDFLALQCYELKYDVLCLPHGQNSLPQSILPLFEPYDKLVLWFGEDPTSLENMRLFARKLNNERCYLVRSQATPYKAHQDGLGIPSIVITAQKVAHSSIVTFSNLRKDILSELQNSDKVSGVKWSRFPALNTILKGHRRGELTILTGPTGSGKTTFISEYSLDLAVQKVSTLWGSFEIRNQRLARTMLQQMFGSPLQDNLDKFDIWADKFEQLPIYYMTFHGQQALDTVMEAVKHASYVYDISHVIIDNVQFMLGLSSTESGFLDRFYRQDALIGSFRDFATTYNCHVTLIIHPRKEREGEALSPSSIFGGAKASQEADNVLIIQNKVNNSNLKLRKFLQIAKNRFSGDLGNMPLDFDREALSFQPRITK